MRCERIDFPSFVEVPGEISLTLSMTGCPGECEGCHSPHLRDEGRGDVVTHRYLYEAVLGCMGNATCVTFLGGDWDPTISWFIVYLRSFFPELKFCLYSGLDKIDREIMMHLDYLKLGPYVKALGPLSSPTTNQRMYVVKGGCITDDITDLFWR